MSTPDSAYRVAVTGDQVAPDGTSIFGPLPLHRLSEQGLEWEVIPVASRVLTAQALAGFEALLMMGGAGITADSLVGTQLRHIARFGAGFDAIDVAACTDAGVLLTNAPDAVRTPMAHAALAMLFALAHNLVIKDRLVRTGRWRDRSDHHGRGLQHATVGLIGLGGVGAETARLARALGIPVLAYNRTARPELAAELGLQQLPLEEVAARSDYLIVTVAGNPATVGLISADILARMPAGSFLINIARGSVVDEDALVAALDSGHLAGAALDVFREEPLPAASRLIESGRTVLAPHSLCWTETFASDVAASAIDAIIDAAQGRMPASCVNPIVWPLRSVDAGIR